MCFESGKYMEQAHSYGQQWCKSIRFAAMELVTFKSTQVYLQ